MGRLELTLLLWVAVSSAPPCRYYEYLQGSQEPYRGTLFAIAGGGLTLLGMIGVVYLDHRGQREARKADRR